MSTFRPAGVAANQATVFLRLWRDLRPHVRSDRNLPARVQQRLARERSFGSRDRRLYRELIYTAIRHLPWVESCPDEVLVTRVAQLAAETPATHSFRVAHARALPEDDTLHREDLLPNWLRSECPAAFAPAQLDALLTRAPLWLRLQTADPASVATEFAAHGWSHTPSPLLPDAWRLESEVDVTKTEAYAQGRIEIQDLGSQMILASLGLAAAPGDRWLDACAGAGGKTLQLARLLGPDAHVAAHDIRAGALDELQARAQRAGLGSRIAVKASPSGEFDGVLVDAPCSGSGTWRRAPHLKWITTPAEIANYASLQRELLGRYARHVRPGGRLIYATCSLCRSENEAVIEAFLAVHPQFVPHAFACTFGLSPTAMGLSILPAAHDTDGFFVAQLRREN